MKIPFEKQSMSRRERLSAALAGQIGADHVARLGRLSRKNLVIDLHHEGWRAERIADLIGVSARQVHNRLAVAGLGGRRGRTRRVGAFVSSQRHDVIEALAVEAATSTSAMVKRILDQAAPDLESGRRFLGKLARPVRQYGGVR